MYSLDEKENPKEMQAQPSGVERLLRSLGASGRLVGFKYVVFIVEELLKTPCDEHWLTKGVYPETGKHFNVSAFSVERAIRVVIKHCWDREDHAALDHVAGIHLEKRPKNAEFLDMLVAFLRYNNKDDFLIK